MRKIPLLLFLVMAFICNQLKAQKSYIENEGSFTIRTVPTDYDFHLFTEFIRLNRNDLRWGYVLRLSSDANTMTYTTGVVYKIESFHMLALETSIGPQLDKDIRTKRFSIGVLGKFSLYTKTSRDRAQGKIRCSNTLSYSKLSGWWHEAYLTVSPVKWIDLGILDQTHSVHLGGLIRINLPGGIRFFFAADNKKQSIGLNISGQLQ